MTPEAWHQLRGAARLGLLLPSALPPAALERVGLPCPIRVATGRPCPTCGLTRSWSATSRLRLGQAFAYHPAGPLTYALAGAVALGLEADLPAGRRRAAAAVALAAWVALAAVRFARGPR